jgi:hypothetical protein
MKITIDLPDTLQISERDLRTELAAPVNWLGCIKLNFNGSLQLAVSAFITRSKI